MNLKLLTKGGESKLETTFGVFNIKVYLEDSRQKEHVALWKAWDNEKVPLLRIHSECATGDVFSSVYCDCRQQLLLSQQIISEQGGIFLYLRQEGRGLGLSEKIKSYELQSQGLDTLDANLHLGRAADERDYTIAAEILYDFGVKKVRLLTNNPDKMKFLETEGFDVLREALHVPPLSQRAKFYMQTKQHRMGHMFQGE